MRKDLKVFQANSFVESRQTYTVQEKRLLSTLIAHIKPSDEEFVKYDISIEDLAMVSKTTKENFYNITDDITDSLMSKIIKIDTDDKKGFKKFHVISRAEYQDGVLSLQIHSDMNNIFLKLQESKQFTAYNLVDFIALSSTHAQRIYELLKQYEHSKQKERTITIDDLKKMLGIDKKYKIYSAFKEKVLDIALKQIGEHTTLRYQWEGKKTGRKITSIRFYNISIAGKTTHTKEDEAQFLQNKVGDKFYHPAADKIIEIFTIERKDGKICVTDSTQQTYNFKDMEQLNNGIAIAMRKKIKEGK